MRVIHERLEGLLHVAGQVLLARAVARGLLPADPDAGPIDPELARAFTADGQDNLPVVRCRRVQLRLHAGVYNVALHMCVRWSSTYMFNSFCVD